MNWTAELLKTQHTQGPSVLQIGLKRKVTHPSTYPIEQGLTLVIERDTINVSDEVLSRHDIPLCILLPLCFALFRHNASDFNPLELGIYKWSMTYGLKTPCMQWVQKVIYFLMLVSTSKTFWFEQNFRVETAQTNETILSRQLGSRSQCKISFIRFRFSRGASQMIS